LRRVLEPHGDVEPIEDRGLRDTGIPQDRPQTGTTVGECGQLGVFGSAHGFKVSADQRRDVGTSLHHRSEHLSPSGSRLDVADANLQVSLAVFAAADEGRIQGDSDRRRHRGCRLDHGVFEQFKASTSDVLLAKGTNNNKVTGQNGTITDLGSGNQTTGLKVISN
jgi:hypothetical protein